MSALPIYMTVLSTKTHLSPNRSAWSNRIGWGWEEGDKWKQVGWRRATVLRNKLDSEFENVQRLTSSWDGAGTCIKGFAFMNVFYVSGLFSAVLYLYRSWWIWVLSWSYSHSKKRIFENPTTRDSSRTTLWSKMDSSIVNLESSIQKYFLIHSFIPNQNNWPWELSTTNKQTKSPSWSVVYSKLT